MGHFLDIAYKVLDAKNRPLTAKKITEIGLAQKWLKTKGRTPWQTMKSKLSTDILNKREHSLFLRTKQGEFGLRDWVGDDDKEYIADRFKKSILDETIVVFPRRSLGKYISGNGLHKKPLKNSRELIHECRPMSRIKAEKNFDMIQLVTVFLLKYKNKFLTYKRTKRLPENRLHGSYSIGFGGHIQWNEFEAPLFDIFQPNNHEVIMRELTEEIRYADYSSRSIAYNGLIYDNSREISSQHLGIVFVVSLGSDQFEIGERGFLMDPKFETIEEMYQRINDFENWSVTLIQSEKIRR